jgi:OHCU decarboxylase
VDGLTALNQLDPAAARAALLGCCGAREWASSMERARPYGSADALARQAERAFDGLDRAGWLEAFAAHARIGEPDAADPHGAGEQAGVSAASADDRSALAARNAAYEARFGHVFLICATGLDARATIDALDARYANAPELELALAGAEQRKITRLRLDGLLRG